MIIHDTFVGNGCRFIIYFQIRISWYVSLYIWSESNLVNFWIPNIPKTDSRSSWIVESDGTLADFLSTQTLMSTTIVPRVSTFWSRTKVVQQNFMLLPPPVYHLLILVRPNSSVNLLLCYFLVWKLKGMYSIVCT